MTEEQPYEVLRDFGDFELRHYPSHDLVQVHVAGDFQRAANSGFGPLFRYISGDNVTSARISMTAPVIQEPTTATMHTVSFVLPEGMDPSSIPAPSDSRVSTKHVPAQAVAVRAFGGGWSEARFRENGEALLAAVRRESLEPVGSAYFARFDPPWKPGFLKRNEALIRVAGD